MPGKTEFLLYSILLISLVAMTTDLTKGKIYNWLTLPAMGVGILVSFWLGEWSGLWHSLLGVGVGFLLYGWMFAIGIMGAGDVKLLMAFGAWGGAKYAFSVGLLGVILGGGFALIALLVSGRLLSFLKRIYRFLLTVFVRELELEVPKLDRTHTIPFGVALSISAVWIVISNPLKTMGLSL